MIHNSIALLHPISHESEKLVLRPTYERLKGTLHHGLPLHINSSLHLHAYSNTDWAGCPDNRRSTSGFCVFLGSNLISWSSKKQHTVSPSSTEAEYRSMAIACTELVWLQHLLQELHVPLSSPPTLWCENLGATFLASHPIYHGSGGEEPRVEPTTFHLGLERRATRLPSPLYCI